MVTLQATDWVSKGLEGHIVTIEEDIRRLAHRVKSGGVRIVEGLTCNGWYRVYMAVDCQHMYGFCVPHL